uniref:U3 small nucleolar RNA-associated protein 6 n=1 Tax=Davidia involucrata TaxID=16924 RepID=A0A5B6ZWP1_DAVIN
MADVVQYKLERMVNELDDLERRGLFTRREIAEIVKQRRKFEYRLKRPSPLKQDFLAYIDYEKQLDALRLLRKKAVARELKKKGNKKMKKSISDFSGVSRIIEIYRLATNRFKGDIELWFQYLEFCRERQNGRMKKVLAQVIRFHPKVPGIWIYAAAWEFDHNLNAAAARALMQSGLRACPTSEDLWVEYLRMELTYLNKLKARKVALGEDEGTLIRDHQDADEKQWRDENKELFMALDEKREDDKAPDVQNEESKKKLDLFRKQGLSILRTIYCGAVEALPSSFILRMHFFEILEATDLEHSEEMRIDILADMKRDFSKEPEYWDWLAKLETIDPTGRQEISKEIMSFQLEKAMQVYEEAIKVVPSAMMFNLYTKFLMDAIVHKNEETQSSVPFSTSDHTLDPISHMLEVYEKAESMGCITEDLACQHVSFYLQLGRLDDARELAEKLCNGKLSDSVQLWFLRLSIEMRSVAKKSPSPTKADLLSIFELLKNVMRKVTISEAETLWLMAFKFFANQRHYFDKLVEISLVSLAKEGGSDKGFSLSSAIVNLVLQKDGIQCAREMYKRFLALPHPGLAIYKNCIELELNLASAGDKDCLVKTRKLYESALTTYDQDVSLWRDFYSMEIKMGTSETATAVYWRARKTLKDNVALLPSPDL